MPKGTNVARCVGHLKAKGATGGKPYAVCQAATGRGYQSGKILPWARGKGFPGPQGRRGGRKMAELPKFDLQEQPQQDQNFELCGMSRGKNMKHKHFRMAGNTCSKRNSWRVMSEPVVTHISIPDTF